MVGVDEKRVLVIDDAGGILDVITSMLEMEGYEVVTALDVASLACRPLEALKRCLLTLRSMRNGSNIPQAEFPGAVPLPINDVKVSGHITAYFNVPVKRNGLVPHRYCRPQLHMPGWREYPLERARQTQPLEETMHPSPALLDSGQIQSGFFIRHEIYHRTSIGGSERWVERVVSRMNSGRCRARSRRSRFLVEQACVRELEERSLIAAPSSLTLWGALSILNI